MQVEYWLQYLFASLSLSSRKLFGVVTEQKVLLVLLAGGGPRGGSQLVQQAVCGLLQEQGKYFSHLNIIR